MKKLMLFGLLLMHVHAYSTWPTMPALTAFASKTFGVITHTYTCVPHSRLTALAVLAGATLIIPQTRPAIVEPVRLIYRWTRIGLAMPLSYCAGLTSWSWARWLTFKVLGCSDYCEQQTVPPASISAEGHWTILGQAICDGDISKIKKMVENEPSIVNRLMEGTYPLHIAIECKQPEAFKTLVDLGANIEVRRPQNNMTPLAHATETGQHDIIEFLLTKKADTESRDIYNMTPLGVAATHNQLRAAEILLRQGNARVNVKDSQNCTPLQRAREARYSDVEQLLRRTGATE